MGDETVDRRRFIGLGIAVAGGAAAIGPGPWVARASLCWESTAGFPGRPNSVTLRAPDLPDGAEVEVRILVQGPDPDQPEVELTRMRARVEAGEACLEAPMSYPYAARIAGHYRYLAQAHWRGARITTLEPATYTLGRWLPLS